MSQVIKKSDDLSDKQVQELIDLLEEIAWLSLK